MLSETAIKCKTARNAFIGWGFRRQLGVHPFQTARGHEGHELTSSFAVCDVCQGISDHWLLQIRVWFWKFAKKTNIYW